MKLLTATALVASLAMAGSASAAVNLVTNGSFELGANGLTGWTLGSTGNPQAQGYSPTVVIVTDGVGRGYPAGAFGDGVIADNAAGPFANDGGSHAIYFSSDIGQESLSQTINLSAGYYEVGFDAYVPGNGFNNPQDATFVASIGTYTWDPVLLKGTAIGPNNWKHYFATVFIDPAQANVPTSFTFAAQGYPAVDVLVDHVYITSAVPEPATWGLMIAGFGMAGAMLRRRRPQIA